MNLPVKIASRSSPLALAQIEEIILDLKTQGTVFEHEIITFETTGDKDKTTPLTPGLRASTKRLRHRNVARIRARQDVRANEEVSSAATADASRAGLQGVRTGDPLLSSIPPVKGCPIKTT